MSSDFLGKPRWWGVPILVRSNVRFLLRFLAIVFGLAMIIAIIAAGLNWENPEKRLLAPIQAFVATSTVFVFLVGWFVAFFFFMRAFISAFRMNFNRSDRSRFWSLKAWYVPFYGSRAEDLSDEGLRLRRLAIEGLVGFLAVFGVVWLMVLASKAVGIDFQAN